MKNFRYLFAAVPLKGATLGRLLVAEGLRMRDSYGDGNRRGMVPLLSPVGCGVRLGKNNAIAGLGTGFFSQQTLGGQRSASWLRR